MRNTNNQFDKFTYENYWIFKYCPLFVLTLIRLSRFTPEPLFRQGQTGNVIPGAVGLAVFIVLSFCVSLSLANFGTPIKLALGFTVSR